MDLLANVLLLLNNIEHMIIEILSVRRSEPNTEVRGRISHSVKQLCKADSRIIAASFKGLCEASRVFMSQLEYRFRLLVVVGINVLA